MWEVPTVGNTQEDNPRCNNITYDMSEKITLSHRKHVSTSLLLPEKHPRSDLKVGLILAS